MRRNRQFEIAITLVLVFILSACGASAREKALHTTYVTVTTAQAGFEAWDREHQMAIVNAATSQADGLAKLSAYHDKRKPVCIAFEATYRMLAGAAILNKDHKSMPALLGAALQLWQALEVLTGKRWPL